MSLNLRLIDFDNSVVFINLETLEEFFNLNENKRNLEIYLKNPQNIDFQKKLLNKILAATKFC